MQGELLLETTWDHLVRLGCSPPADLVKERFITMLENDNICGALFTIINHPKSGPLNYPSKKAWLKLFKENVQRFQKDTLACITREVRVHMASTESPLIELQNFVESCDEFLRTGW